MSEIDRFLRPLADPGEEFQYDRGTALFLYHGRELTITLSELPGLGTCVVVPGEKQSQFVPLSVYVQRELLQLPTLAQQVLRTLERAMRQRAIRYIESPARMSIGTSSQRVEAVKLKLSSELIQRTPDETRIYQLLASAGQGKTILLEQLAIDFAREYKVDVHPQPLLLNIDLLGRYVGNLEDAIAGSLSNTYNFPNLNQRDVIYALHNGWLMLALDGFDELAARVGARDAFLRLNELLEQLGGAGTVILSARQSFFDLYQVTYSIRSFLQPRKGSYSTTLIELQHWAPEHGIQVFELLGSAQPQSDLLELLKTFGDDISIALHPFFLPKLAELWLSGERFAEVVNTRSELARVRYVLDTFIGHFISKREVTEKWIDRTGVPFLTPNQHKDLLAVIAEEMWRARAFKLDLEELRLATESALLEMQVSTTVHADVLARIPSHAALTKKDTLYSFVHDKFFHYYLGYRLAILLSRGDPGALTHLLSAGELMTDVLGWIPVSLPANSSRMIPVVSQLVEMSTKTSDSMIAQNVAAIACHLLDGYRGVERVQLKQMTFMGEVLARHSYFNVDFVSCRFWHCNLVGTKLSACTVRDCSFGDVQVNSATSLGNTKFENTSFSSLADDDHGVTLFLPSEIENALVGYGAKIERAAPVVQQTKVIEIDDSVLQCIERLLRVTDRATDVAVEDLETRFGEARTIVKLGVQSGVLRYTHRSASGPKRTFVRFAIDRSKLLKGRVESTGIAQIDQFWQLIRTKYRKLNS